MLERVGDCRIVGEIAAGGMAIVYKAIQDHLERPVAVKVLRPEMASQESVLERFEREARALADLQHQGIIHVHGFHVKDEQHYMVMEFVDGIDLYDLLENSSRVPPDAAAIIAVQLARALDYIHYRGLIHRDIKPANIMLTKQGGVKLMDFGIARTDQSGDLTGTGIGLGTPSYMSPEQALGNKLDARSDLFSLGIVLYQMLTGEKPFVEDDTKSSMQKILHEKYIPVRKRNPDVPRELEKIVDRCLQKAPRNRFESAQHLVAVLERFLSRNVEINHQARIVLLLQHHGVVSLLEAQEYLGSSNRELSQKANSGNLKRQSIRKTWINLIVTMLISFLVVGVLHAAPIGNDPNAVPEYGYVRFVIHPWGTVYVDDEMITTTPAAKPFRFLVGERTLKIEHRTLGTFQKTIAIPKNSAESPLDVIIDLRKEEP